MRNILIATIAGAALVGCGSERSGTIETEDGEVEYSVNQSGETTTASFAGADGQQVEMQTGDGADIDWPAGYSLYPRAEVLSTMTMRQEGGSGLMVSFQSDDGLDDIVAYYRRQAEAAGVKIEMELKSGEMQSIGGEGFSLNVSPGGSGATVGQLIVSEGM